MKFRLNTPEQEAAIAELNGAAVEDWGWDFISSSYVDLSKRVVVTLMDGEQIVYYYGKDGSIQHDFDN